MKIHSICMKYSIRLRAEWIPRDKNELADYYSKVIDTDDWQVHPNVFREIDSQWGPYTLDCFSSLRTKQLDRYCSIKVVEPGLFCS